MDSDGGVDATNQLSADDLFVEVQALRKAIVAAEAEGDVVALARLEGKLIEVRQSAKLAAFDPIAGGEELLVLRHQLRKLAQVKKRLWKGRDFNRLDGSPSDDMKQLSDVPFEQDNRERITKRIYELEESLIALDAMGNIPPLRSDNIEKWW